MELILEAEQAEGADGRTATVTVRLIALNDTYEPVPLDRRLLIGPNVVPERANGLPLPVSVEPSAPTEEQNTVTLNPWCFYGRQRSFDGLAPGRATVYAYLLARPTDALLPNKPAEPDASYQSAEPVELTIDGGA